MTEREQEILALLRQDPMIAQQELADRLGISRSALASHISSLMRQGYVKGRDYLLREGPYAVVIGGANMDICGCSHDNLRIGDSNPGKVRTSAGGVGRNIAENLARLGTDTRLLSAVGNDQYGHHLLEVSQRQPQGRKGVEPRPGAQLRMRRQPRLQGQEGSQGDDGQHDGRHHGQREHEAESLASGVLTFRPHRV